MTVAKQAAKFAFEDKKYVLPIEFEALTIGAIISLPDGRYVRCTSKSPYGDVVIEEVSEAVSEDEKNIALKAIMRNDAIVDNTFPNPLRPQFS